MVCMLPSALLVCTHTYVGCARMHIQRTRGGPFALRYHLAQGLSLYLAGWPVSSQDSPVPAQPSTGVPGTLSHSWLLHGAEHPNSGPHPCVANALTHGAVSPAYYHHLKKKSESSSCTHSPSSVNPAKCS